MMRGSEENTGQTQTSTRSTVPLLVYKQSI
jgi:hypothetical protein